MVTGLLSVWSVWRGNLADDKHYGVFDPGFAIDDDLVVLDHLGGSPKVDTYLCRSKRLGGHVACKVLRHRYAADISALEDVLEEGNRLIRLDHPNVVHGYAVELLPVPRVVLEYIPGQTLNNALFKGNYEAFRMGDLLSIARQVADGLTHVHERGMLHLDVKPPNIMFDGKRAVLFDFSVAEEFDPETPLRDNAGTTEYMAPEQTYRKPLGYFTDVFGLGVVFYRMLTGGVLPYPVTEGPLPGYDEDDVRKHLDYSVEVARPSSHNAAVTGRLDAVAMKAIAVDPEDRYRNPAEFRRALGR